MYASYRNQVDFNHLSELYETYPKFDDFCAVSEVTLKLRFSY